MPTQNTAPAQITFKYSVAFSTVDQNNNNTAISEAYVVTGPTAPGISPIFLAGGSKCVIPLSTATGDGAPFLKIHFPTVGNVLYVTYAVSNSLMADGYYDYKTGVPQAYWSALRTWINTNPSTGQAYVNTTPKVRARTLKFISYGAGTNKPQNAVTFFVKFQGTFGTIPTLPISTGNPNNVSR